MNRVSLVAGRTASPTIERAVHQLLVSVDEEFLPPLSARHDTRSRARVEAGAGRDLGRYLGAMRNESWLVAFDGERVIGLLSFTDRPDEAALLAWTPSLYITTIAVAAEMRRAGVGNALYDNLEAIANEREVPYLTTRTWTTNASHLRLLRSRGFIKVAEQPHDRAAGLGTVYLAYRSPSERRDGTMVGWLSRHPRTGP